MAGERAGIGLSGSHTVEGSKTGSTNFILTHV